MNRNLEDLMYEAGLTAQGCWDEMDDYDRTAILKFGELIVQECANMADDPYDEAILKHFGAVDDKQPD